MKKALLVSFILLFFGGVIFLVAFGSYGFNYDKMSNSGLTEKKYEISEAFSDIEIDVSFTDVKIAKSYDGKASVQSLEKGKITYSVSVKEGKLTVTEVDGRHWFKRLFTPDCSITLYLPDGIWGKLGIDTASGDVTVAKDITFSAVDIEGSSSDVRFLATVTGKTEIETSSGDVDFIEAALGNTEIETSSGEVFFDKVSASGNISVETSSGEVECEGLDVTGELKIKSSSGDVGLDNCLSGSLHIEVSSGDVEFDRSDAENIFIETSSGDVEGSLLTGKVFDAKASSGSVRVPDDTVGGGICKIRTSSGDIEISVID